jgi:hypothetical protein
MTAYEGRMEYLHKAWEFILSTNVISQVNRVDYEALFTNPWFMVPFGLFILVLVIWGKWRVVILVAIAVGIWIFSGTEYIAGMVVDGEINLPRLIPFIVAGLFVAIIALFALLGRSD